MSNATAAWDWTPKTLGRLASFLAERSILHGDLTTRPIGDGHSNLTFLVSDGERQVVVRRPPPPPTPPGAHDMLREARIVTALEDSDVPVATVLATAQVGEVIDVSFYVMSFADGPVVTTSTPPHLDDPVGRRALGEAVIDTLADLHSVDWRAAGLTGFGKPEGFNARHLRRLGGLVADEHGAPPAHFAALDSWLNERVPPESGDSIVHNDYRIGNVVVAPDRPARVQAVLDWELATIGDPLFDLGYFISSVPEHGDELTPTAELGIAMLEEGYSSREELVERYAERTGRDVSGLAWYVTLALWKLAVLYEYGHRRAARGIGDPYYADQRLVQSFLQAAHRSAGLPPPPEPAQESR
jgi:aminoglycoside phosphotransferase (APT) family kinase protein